MPETVGTKPSWGDRGSSFYAGVKKRAAAVRYYYRIRPIPGVDNEAQANAGKAISFNDLFKELWVDWRILFTAISLGLISAIFLIVTSAPSYKAELDIAPAESSFTSSTSSSAAQSVLSLFSKGPATYDEYAQFLDLMHSVRLAKRMDEKYGLMKKVFPYDEKTKKFVPPSGLKPWLGRAARWMLGLPTWRPPGPVDLAGYLKGAAKIDRGADGTTITHYGPTPEKAARFLSRIFAETDELMREEKLNSHRKRRQYVADRLASTQPLEQRNLLIGLWGQEESQILLLTSGDPVGARKIDDMHVPNMPQTGAATMLIMGPLLGLLIGLFLIVGRSALRRV